jgi:hypothetical protein
VKARTLGEVLIDWATVAPEVALLVLIGSRVRPPGTVAAADEFSDWDFQIATTEPAKFAAGDWLRPLGITPLAYVLRPGRLGSSLKASAVTAQGELDLVVLPADQLRVVANRLGTGAGADDSMVTQALRDLAAVLGGGYRILKGENEFGPLYRQVARASSPLRLDDAEVVRLAEAFVCDYVSTRRKLQRGEWRAALRWLHHQLVETNFRLLHELRLRQGLDSFPDGRRLEGLGDPALEGWEVGTGPGVQGLGEAVEKAAGVHRLLVAALLGETWRWPDLSALRLRAE